MMNKKELVAAVADDIKMPKRRVEAVLNSISQHIVAEVAKKGKVRLSGFGAFTIRERASRLGKNPQTGKSITIDAATVPVFKAGKTFKDAVNAKPEK